MKKIAIRVNTEFDRLNVIAWFEKHYPKCNKQWNFTVRNCEIGDMWLIDKDCELQGFEKEEDLKCLSINLSDYTILEGVPTDLSIPTELDKWVKSIEPMSKILKTREQEVEECLRNIVGCTRQAGNGRNRLNDNKLYIFHLEITKAKQLLSK